uniref:(northern house mosquito) hypothetical protein n=1 Tax=Culex pipiens TaxID=7175 RepID=A0A8D8PC43_CULPI
MLNSSLKLRDAINRTSERFSWTLPKQVMVPRRLRGLMLTAPDSGIPSKRPPRSSLPLRSYADSDRSGREPPWRKSRIPSLPDAPARLFRTLVRSSHATADDEDDAPAALRHFNRFAIITFWMLLNSLSIDGL